MVCDQLVGMVMPPPLSYSWMVMPPPLIAGWVLPESVLENYLLKLVCCRHRAGPPNDAVSLGGFLELVSLISSF